METVMIKEKELTYEQAFRKQWNWLADNPDKRKPDFFNEFNIPRENIPINCCYACQANSSRWCDTCVVQWENGECISLTSPYYLWHRAELGSAERSKYARIIANLPWVDIEEG